jgi:hypothetical protein
LPRPSTTRSCVIFGDSTAFVSRAAVRKGEMRKKIFLRREEGNELHECQRPRVRRRLT